MDPSRNNVEIADRFAAVAKQFCDVVDIASSLDRAEFLVGIYPILPKLIDLAISMPDIEIDDSNEETPDHGSRLGHKEWQSLFELLKEKLGDWDSYQLVFDPIQDNDVVGGSLADDIADIHRDLKEVLVDRESISVSPEDQIWEWRFSFRTHWGKHAIDALQVIHTLLHYY